MQLQIEQLNREEQELESVNEQMKNRALKFGSEFTPLTLSDYKLFKIQKARQTGNIQYLDNILLSEIQDLQERKNKIKARLQNFYPQLKVQTGQKFFAPKQMPDFSEDNVLFRPEAWYIFGVDYMSNQKIRHYFNLNPHFKIEWINDSSCNLVYNSKEEAEEAIKIHMKNSGEGMKDENDIWYELEQYEVEGVKRKLFARLSTNKDVKKQEVHGHKSQYYRWKINKDKLKSYVKKKANWEISKTKNISRQDKYHQTKTVKKREQSESQSSSSGLSQS